MSVTFTIESNPTGAFTLSCYDSAQGEVEVARADSYESILVERAAHMAVCEDCQHYGCYSSPVMDVDDSLDVNLANTNARMILVRLGLDGDDDLCGMLSGEQFLGAVMIAQATLSAESDAVVSAAVLSSPGQATMIDCGTPEGYTSGVLARLADLATEAVRLGRDVAWS